MRALLALGVGCSLVLGGCSLTRSLDDLSCQSDAECVAGRCDESERVCKPCPAQTQLVRFDDGSAFCVDELEVQAQEYASFLESVSATNGQDRVLDPAICSANLSYEPEQDGCVVPETDPGSSHLPVVCVDFCDARAYCAWAGKRLCGGRGGEQLRRERLGRPGFDEWFKACIDTTVGVADLTGSVAEWSNACEPGELRCLVRGGAYEASQGIRTGCAVHTSYAPSQRMSTIGIRCCVD